MRPPSDQAHASPLVSPALATHAQRPEPPSSSCLRRGCRTAGNGSGSVAVGECVGSSEGPRGSYPAPQLSIWACRVRGGRWRVETGGGGQMWASADWGGHGGEEATRLQ